ELTLESTNGSSGRLSGFNCKGRISDSHFNSGCNVSCCNLSSHCRRVGVEPCTGDNGVGSSTSDSLNTCFGKSGDGVSEQYGETYTGIVITEAIKVVCVKWERYRVVVNRGSYTDFDSPVSVRLF